MDALLGRQLCMELGGEVIRRTVVQHVVLEHEGELVTVEVAVPEELSDEQRQSVEALGAVMDGEALRTSLWSDQ